MPEKRNTDLAAALEEGYAPRLDGCLAARGEAQARIDAGALPSFPAESRELREADWRVAAADSGQPAADAYAVGDATSRAALATAGAALAGGARYLELSDLRSRDEARLWHDVLKFSAEHGGASGVRMRLPVDSVQAAFQLEEIVYELRDHAVALTWHRNRYLLSFIRAFHEYPQLLLPDRSELAIGAPFLRALGKHAMRIGEERGLAVDGFPVPSPDSVNPVESEDLLQISKGKITEEGIRENLRILLHWETRAPGDTTVTIDEERHDEASADLALAQLRQWNHHVTGVLDVGRKVDLELIGTLAGGEGPTEAAQRVLERIAEADA